MSHLENILTCPVCLSRFNDARILPCQHTFCLRPCLVNIYDSSIRSIKCPICRQSFRAFNGPEQLPKNLTVQSLLDMDLNTSNNSAPQESQRNSRESNNEQVNNQSHSTSERTSNTNNNLELGSCTNCDNRRTPVTSCAHCHAMVCSTCHSEHLELVRSNLRNNIQVIQDFVPQIQRRTETLRLEIENFENHNHRIRYLLSNTFDTLIEKLEERKELLLGQFDHQNQLEHQKGFELLSDLELELASLGSLCDSTNLNNLSLELVQNLSSRCGQVIRDLNSSVLTHRAAQGLTKLDFTANADILARCISTLGALHNQGSRPPISQTSPDLMVHQHYRSSALDSRETFRVPAEYDTRRSLSSNSTPLSNGRATWSTRRSVPEPLSSQIEEVAEANTIMTFANPSFRGGRSRPPRAGGRNNSNNNNNNRTAAAAGQAAIRRAEQNLTRNISYNIHETPAQETQVSENRTNNNGSINVEDIPSSSSAPPDLPASLLRSNTFVLNNKKRNPVAFEVNSGRNSPADNNRIDYLNMSNPVKIFGAHGNGHGHFNGPRGVSVCASSGQIFIADSNNHRVQRFSPNGEYISTFGEHGSGEGQMDCVTGISVDPKSKKIFTTNRFNHKVMIYNMDGQFVSEFGSEGSDPGQFRYPWGIAASDGQVFVADKKNHRVQVFDMNGNFISIIGCHGREDGEFDDPHYVSVRPDKLLFVSDSNNNRIQVFDISERCFKFRFGSEGHGVGQMKHPRGIACDKKGNLLVADSGNNRVQVFRPDGSFLCQWGSTGSRPGRFKGAEGIVVLRNGRIAVSDRDNHRVQIF